jgi:hypothetical protein
MHQQLANYLKKYKTKLEAHYDWGINDAIPRDRFGFTFSGKTSFAKTLELKQQLSYAAASSSRLEDKYLLAEYIIKDWGGIKRFSKIHETVQRLEPLRGKDRPASFDFAFENISSWSKWLSVICPNWALIYDARVAYSLNAINFMSGSKAKIFPVPAGRNSTMKLLDSSTLAISLRLNTGEEDSAKALRATHLVPDNDAYLCYLDTVTQAHKVIWADDDRPIVYTEMLLFALADTVIFRDLLAFHRKCIAA